MRASEILMNPSSEAAPLFELLIGEEIMALSPEEFLIRFWPLTVSEFATGSSAVWKKVIERTPSRERLIERFQARLIIAYRQTKDRETLHRVFTEGWKEMREALATAYEVRHDASVAQGKTRGKSSGKQRQEEMKRRRTVIAKILSRYENLSSTKAAENFTEQYHPLKHRTLRNDIDWIRRQKK